MKQLIIISASILLLEVKDMPLNYQLVVFCIMVVNSLILIYRMKKYCLIKKNN